MENNGDEGGRSLIIPRRSHPPNRKQVKDKTRFRLLIGALVTGIVASILFLVAMATTDWVRVHYPSGLYRRSTKSFVESQVTGLFRLCRVEYDNTSLPVVHREYCRMQSFFPSHEHVEDNDEIDYAILDYVRTGAAFAIIALILSSGADFFTWYSINEPRYMFKRVAGSLHLITAACVLVCVEVFRNSLEYARSYLPGRFPSDAQQRFGGSYGVAWTALALYVAVGIAMFLLSTKRKGERAYTAQEAAENEPVHLGRI